MTDDPEALREYILVQEQTIAELNGQIESLKAKMERAARYIGGYMDYHQPSDLEAALAILESE